MSELHVRQTTAILFLLICQYSTAFVVYSNSTPPAPDKVALMARYIMHNSDWVSIATISTQKGLEGYPFVTLKSLSDGPDSNATGIPYLYMTDMDVSGQDVEKNNRVTIMASLAESDYCQKENFDPQDPRCAKLIISGKLIKLKKSTPEYKFGQEALYARHPAMATWPTGHQFYVATVDIENIDVLDFFGGMKHVTKDEYFQANITNLIMADSFIQKVSVIDVENTY